jgi:hypothetical protein
LNKYYVYELFFLLPVAMASVILHAGAARLVCRAWGGTGTCEDLFVLLGFEYVLIALVMGVPDLVFGLLDIRFRTGGPHVILGTLWYYTLSLLAVKESEHVTWPAACVAGTLGFLANAAIEFTFIR